jgi:hypothetical protein
MAFSINFKDFGKECEKIWDAWITHHNHVKVFTKIKLALLVVRIENFAMACATLDFIVIFKDPC